MKLNSKRTTLVGLAFMSICAFWQFYDQVVPFILENTMRLSTIQTNAIMALDNVLALFMLPLFGMLSDRTSTRLGKRTPYILAGTAVSVVMLVVMGFAEHAVNRVLFLSALFVLLIAMSTYRSPAVALMPDVTPKPLRSKANAIINLMGALGGVFALIMCMVLLRGDESGAAEYAADQNFIPVFTVIALFMLLVIIVFRFTVSEKKFAADNPDHDSAPEAEPGKGQKLPRPVLRSLIFILLSVFLWYMAYNAVTTSFSRYCDSVMGAGLADSSGYLLVATVVATLSYIPIGAISSRVGRKRTIIAGVVLMTVCYGAAFFILAPTPIMYVIFGLVGIGWAAINVNSFPMVVEISTSGDVGKYTGYYYTFSMAAQILTPILSGVFISAFGYHSSLFPYAVIFSALALVTMFFVRHGDSRPQNPSSRLEAFDTD